MRNQSADVVWTESGVPMCTRFDDPYFSLQDGLEETRHVFLAGNDLPARFTDGFHIAELGFGTALNCLATAMAWRQADLPGRLQFTSFEAYPMSAADMSRALAAFPAVRALADPLLSQWSETGGNVDLGHGMTLNVIVGDARDTVGRWPGRADAWFLDGFSPAKNPELWSPDLMRDVAEHTTPGGTCATYTAAGFVRRGLQAAGFDVTRTSGFGRKRHMTRGVLTR